MQGVQENYENMCAAKVWLAGNAACTDALDATGANDVHALRTSEHAFGGGIQARKLQGCRAGRGCKDPRSS